MKFEDKAIDVFLQPGAYFIGDSRHRIRTLLGSCVSITLWHPIKKIGTMSHFLLANRIHDEAAPKFDGRYGKEVMSLMIQELRQLNINANECEGKIFGGGDMFPGQSRSNLINVGRKNGEIARTLLNSQGIPIISESLFGVGHRQIIFDVRNGDVWARQVKPADLGISKTEGPV
jgi:chemotaxis protein CheD